MNFYIILDDCFDVIESFYFYFNLFSPFFSSPYHSTLVLRNHVPSPNTF